MDRAIIEFSVVRWACKALDGSDVGEGGGVSGMTVGLHLGELKHKEVDVV